MTRRSSFRTTAPVTISLIYRLFQSQLELDSIRKKKKYEGLFLSRLTYRTKTNIICMCRSVYIIHIYVCVCVSVCVSDASKQAWYAWKIYNKLIMSTVIYLSNLLSSHFNLDWSKSISWLFFSVQFHPWRHIKGTHAPSTSHGDAFNHLTSVVMQQQYPVNNSL